LPGIVASEQLLGEWSKSHMSTENFVNPSAAAHEEPSGEKLNIRFYPDGSYKVGWLLQSCLNSCTRSIYGYRTGDYTLHGSTLTLEDKSYTLTSIDTCHKEWNYQKHPAPAKPSYELQMGRSSKCGTVLIMRSANGMDVVYCKENGKGMFGK
jgi:hypothetical protein